MRASRGCKVPGLVSGLIVALGIPATTPLCARGEILVLKGGKRIPCRVLARSDRSVTVRDANGAELTVDRDDIARIDPAVSSVEIYEAVAERIPPEGEALAYGLGVWCRENDRAGEAPRLFELASRHPDWAGRARLELAKLAEDPAKRRQELTAALSADPSLSEAAGLLLDEGADEEDVPLRVLEAAASALEEIQRGQYARAAARLSRLEASSKAGSSSLSARLFKAAGFTFDSLEARCRSAGGGAPVVAERAPAREYCDVCSGSGYATCGVCKGDGTIECKVCSGSGTITTRRRSTRTRGTRIKIRECTACGGAGYKECRACIRRPQGALSRAVSHRRAETCSTCDGTGTVSRAVTTTYPSSRYRSSTGSTTTYETTCQSCGGTGEVVRSATTRVSVSASGRRRCQKCNRDGHIPFPGTAGPPSTDGLASADAGNLASPSGRAVGPRPFSGEELRRIDEFASLLRSVLAGTRTAEWLSGEKVLLEPIPFTATEAPKEEVFACGKWVTPSTKKLLERRALALGHSPREVDLSEFRTWMERREMEFLRRESRPLGAGPKPVEEILGFVRLLERARNTGKLGELDRWRIYRTVFLPGRTAGDADALCLWSTAGPAAARTLSFLLVRRTAAWPTLDVGLRPIPGTGCDVASAAETLSGSREFRLSPVTLYYRVRGLRRAVPPGGAGALESVSLGVTLEIVPLAVAAGAEERPRRVWLRLPRGL
jgi:hypothetical protein